MLESDKKAFAELIAGVFAYHRTPVTPAVISVYWRACQAYSMAQVTKAIDALTADAEAGRFVPKIADIVRALQGTQTDRALIAWGKVAAALSDVGAYTDVVFDDPLIHLCIVDHGGWPKFCRTPFDEQSYLQHRFCESYRAYAARGVPSEYPCRLTGAGSGADDWAKRGLPPPEPRLVGDKSKALLVLQGGAAPRQLAAQVVAALPSALVGEAA